MQILVPASVPAAEGDSHAKLTQKQNSLLNISRENTVRAEREKKLNQHHRGGCVLLQLIFSLHPGGTIGVVCLHPSYIQARFVLLRTCALLVYELHYVSIY